LNSRTIQSDVIDMLLTAVLVVDAKLHLQYMNPAAESLFGTSAARALDHSIDQLLYDDGTEIFEGLSDIYESGLTLTRRAAEFRTRQGQDVTADLTISLDPIFECLVIELQPLSRLVRINRDDRARSSFRTTRELIRGLAHEVKNPLQVLGLQMEELEYLVAETSPESRKVLTIMEKAVDRAAEIIRSLLEFARMDELNLRTADLNTVIEDSLQMIRPQLRKARVRLRLELGRELPTVRLDVHKFEQVIINLITNAIHAMAGPGEIGISTRWRFLEEDMPLTGLGDTTHFVPGDRLVEMELRDSGPGIDEDDLKHIFDPFFTTKPPGRGTGLGLPVVQNIVALHNATIDIGNLPNRAGARVLITFKHRKEPHGKEKNTGGG